MKICDATRYGRVLIGFLISIQRHRFLSSCKKDKNKKGGMMEVSLHRDRGEESNWDGIEFGLTGGKQATQKGRALNG